MPDNTPLHFVLDLKYASLFFIVGVGVDSDDENELGVLEFIHCLVETLDKVWPVARKGRLDFDVPESRV